MKNKHNYWSMDNYFPKSSVFRKLRRSGLMFSGLIIISIIFLIGIFAPLVAPDPNSIDISNRFALPSIKHPFGTDHFGRDLWSRVAFGAYISLKVTISSVVISLILGVVIGMIVAYLGGWIESIGMRIVDATLSFPTILLALLLRLVTGPSTISLILTIAFIYVPIFARTTRGSTLIEKEKLYIEAARAIGMSPTRILAKHILPNIMAPIIVLATTLFASAIVIESSLSFLGIGTSIFEPSWGAILSDSKQFLQEYPHVAIFPGFMISLAVLGVNLLGDGLRDILDIGN